MRSTLTSYFKRLDGKAEFQRVTVWLAQVCIFALSGLAAFWLRFDGNVPAPYKIYVTWSIPVWMIAKTVTFRLMGLQRGWWRFVSIETIIRLAAGNFAGSAVSFVILRTIGPRGFPRSVYLLDLLICFLFTAGVRVVMRMIVESHGPKSAGEEQKRAVIYGAGQAGITLLREIRANARLRFVPAGFIDDNPQKHGLQIQGMRVLGSGPMLADLARKRRIDIILIAMPSASGNDMTRVLSYCLEAGIPYKTVPGLAEILESDSLAQKIRNVSMEDLLDRSPVRLQEHRILANVENRTILVTGAAGSIGSELCRQIAVFRPAAIVAYDISESGLFHLEYEMTRSFPEVRFHPEIGSVQNTQRLDEVFARYSPAMVYHAAAYKHVPLMETHVFEAVENNVFGTFNVAVAASEHGVEQFILISSDKAVRPTNVMGATKRLAELFSLSLQNGTTKFVCVRFGNVLGSNGSVVPIFKQQIARGGPVTVTHPEMRRYFMTIPEASQLVLQASTMGRGGEVFVLDMGEAVRIVDVARKLILLSGFRPEHDIRIEFTGVRPGEKLCEELNLIDESVLATDHEKIKIFGASVVTLERTLSCLADLKEIVTTRNVADLVLLMKGEIPDYNPSAELLRRVLTHSRELAQTVGA